MRLNSALNGIGEFQHRDWRQKTAENNRFDPLQSPIPSPGAPEVRIGGDYCLSESNQPLARSRLGIAQSP